MSLVLLIPMLGRPHWVDPLVESIRATCSGRILFGLTPGDDAVYAAVGAAGCEWFEIPHMPGDYARKINTGYRMSTEEHIFVGAGDLLFHPGWYEAACAALAPGIGVVGTNDLGSPRVMNGQHATHSLVTREYADLGSIDRPREILHEGYWHEFCDDELVGTAKKRGAWAFAADSYVKHRHPNWCPDVPMDEVYAKQAVRMRASRALYARRMRKWR